MTALKRKHLYRLAFLFMVVLLIFYPLFYTEYIYTDEATQLWNYRPGSGFSMFGAQGRWITEFLISKSFAAVDTIREVTSIRVFALFMWLACVPLWYVTLKRMAAEGPGYEYLPFFTCLYLVTSLPFSISIQWASCIELPIANTAALLSGAIWYTGIRNKDKLWSIPVGAAMGSVVAGLISLFSYQNGFGCFLIPFVFHYISAYTTRKDQVFVKGLAFYFFMYVLYFLLFKLLLVVNQLSGDARTGVYLNPGDKLQFFFSQALKRAFWFNIVVNDENKLARAMYKILFVGWMLLAFIRFGRLQAVKYIVAALLVFLFAYFPSLVVKENFSSNRTLLAVDMCVFVVCAEMVLSIVKHLQVRRVIGYSVAIVLLIPGWYNFNKGFLQPIHEEYAGIKNYFQQYYEPGITTIYFIRPAEDAFRNKYKLQSSMDEFGVPSTFFSWVPEPLMRQLVYEKTDSREKASQLTIKEWDNPEAFSASGEQVTPGTLVVNVPEIMASGK
ncbi:hypothetical protein [Niastella populi]|uniref:Glycosyltransferase RgtA/B/C/D-like domain-containing protein n=1 Tax=Niastella populi TaxID=550983 RepID=A0A1V9F8A9_9BACT|nr:hypothetical protein [Niastella populi]OQP54456.1 hypothetical protein A4R26_27665 [Niastella populi]